MAGDEWVAGPAGSLKTDFEHRGIGKNELNLYDLAYDLADTILQLRPTRDEEGDLLTRYAAATGDAPQGERLFLCKLMVGLWTCQVALDGIVKQTHTHAAGLNRALLARLGAARALDSTADQHWNLGVRQHLQRVAAENERCDPAPAMRTHDDEVAFLCLCGFDDG